MFLMTNTADEVTDLDLNDFKKFHRKVRFRAKLFKDLKAKVLELLPYQDGNVRTLKLKCGNTEIIRPIQEIFPLGIQPEEIPISAGKSSDLVEETSSKDQLLLDRIQILGEQICQLSILHKSRMKERNSFRPKSPSHSRKCFDPKGKYCYFHFRFGERCKPEKSSPPCAWNRNTENFSLQ
ncbi:hypothetical protein TNCT_452151 [Trichonephila clavata]|uniref:Uncharacterized protein n=1 Tax=Trichonephila clavata TaxID=2740835 RepID=A0A8X6KWW7_TRICU|nr:hypothetical protein TNCT_452151 [Trichonephila clavata]